MLVTAVWLKVMTKSWLKCNDFSSTKTKSIKHFHLKIKTKTKSKMPAKINTINTSEWIRPYAREYSFNDLWTSRHILC